MNKTVSPETCTFPRLTRFFIW